MQNRMMSTCTSCCARNANLTIESVLGYWREHLCWQCFDRKLKTIGDADAKQRKASTRQPRQEPAREEGR